MESERGREERGSDKWGLKEVPRELEENDSVETETVRDKVSVYGKRLEGRLRVCRAEILSL